jgi:ABC-2 type transport system ATP-binding protein
MIEVDHITKRFGDVVAVDDVSFNVGKGEIVGFLGPNGAGKTTTMKVLTCFLAPNAGTARLAGYDILADPVEVRKHIGYLPENTPLYEETNVVDCLAFVASVHDVPSDKIPSRVDEMIDVCSLEKMAHKQIGELSRGYRQRVGLAQAIIHDPEILILDEPTSGLDPTQIIEIREMIKRIAKEKAIILSTHILAEAEATCSRILIINNGSLVGEGTPDELSKMLAGSTTYVVRVRGDQARVKDVLGRQAWAASVDVTGTGDGVSEFEITTEHDRDFGETIFDLAVANGFKISELRKVEATLEDVFLALTGNEEARRG